METGTITLCLKLTIVVLNVLVLINNTDAASHVCTRRESYRQRYKTKCGFLNLGRCTRHRTKYKSVSYCCTGWKSVGNGLACDRAICSGKIDPGACERKYPNSHIIHNNGITQYNSGGKCIKPNKCQCTKDGFYSAGSYCGICSAISNCDLETCTTKSNQKCSRCTGYAGPDVGHQAYVRSGNLKSCIKACSWRPDSTRCYPGTCLSQYASNCRCTSGFSGTHCEIITEKPDISANKIRLTAGNGEFKEAPGNHNRGPSQAVIWTNIVNPSSIYYKFTADFIKTVPTRHAFTPGFKIGIVGGAILFQRVGSVSTSLSRRFSNINNRDNPNTKLATYEETLTNLNNLKLPFRHKDSLKFTMSATNGGFVKVQNKETGIIETKYYSGSVKDHSFSMKFDTVKPYHCTVTTCSGTKLMLKDLDLTKTVKNTITWDGWVDSDSGIKDYHLEGFELHRVGNVLGVKRRFMSQTNTSKSIVVTFPATAVYEFILTVTDNAGNQKGARRINIYDSGSEITTTANSALQVTSASQKTNLQWQNSLTSVKIEWNNRYINLVHHNGRFLAAVQPNTGVTSDYDDTMSGVRRISAINNVQGIVKYETVYKIDHKDGTSIANPADRDFQSTGDLSQSATIKPSLKDGDTLKYFIRAYDVLSQYKEESVTVHFDSSPPIIENLYLTKGDELNIAVHGFEELNKMVIEWIAYDVHSGLDTVQWRIYDKLTEIEHGSEHIPPQGETTSMVDCVNKYSSYPRSHKCYCLPGGNKCYHRHFQVKPKLTTTQGEGILNNIGTHDHDYHITVTVINTAKLSTTSTYQITIDKSPPHEGTVHDGVYGSQEIDFQTDMELSAHWDGFFDRESGVKFYQYGFHTSCLDASKFSLDLSGRMDVIQTTSTHASWKAELRAKYFVTVVAYNRALEPSNPVCSDGVIIDNSAPSVGEIFVEGARIIGGLIKDPELNEVYYITETRQRYLLENVDDSCRNKATVADLSLIPLFPVKRFSNGTVMTMSASQFCDKNPLQPSFMSKVYLSKHNHIYVNWTGIDKETGIYDYEFGLSSDKESSSAPDILQFISTNHHSWYKGYHPQLTDGTEFYIDIKATNKAGRSTIQALGPILVHTVPPIFNGDIMVNFINDKLQVDWSSGKFSDPESLHLKLSLAVGNTPGGQEVLPFLSDIGGACNIDTTSCRTFTKHDLHWDLHHTSTYYVSLRIENIVGLYSIYTSKPYNHNIRLPSRGIVYEVMQPDESKDFKISDLEDSNFQLSKTTLTTRWFGFESDDLAEHITYKVGIGSVSGMSDITEVSVGLKTSHTFQGLNLQLHKTYFVSVTAKSQSGTLTVTSNGVTIVEKNVNLEDKVSIKDGLGCGNTGEKLVWQPNHYHNIQTIQPVCKEDLDFQVSTSIYTAHWTISTDFKHLYPDIKWALQVKQDNTDDIWSNVIEKDFLLNPGHLSETVALDNCKAYRSNIMFCSGEVCSKPVVSNGVIILSEPEIPQMKIDHKKEQNSLLEVILTYKDGGLNGPCSVLSSNDKLEWSLTDNKNNSHLFTKWKQVNELKNLAANQFQLTIRLAGEVDFTECRRLAVRIFNKAGISAIVSSDIKNCSAIDPVLIIPSIVIDAIGQPVNPDFNTNQQGTSIILEKNALWSKQDVDYTPYNNVLSAVFPTLRHGKYVWGLIEDTSFSTTTHFTRQLQIIKDPCSHPSKVECGTTENEYVNIYLKEKLIHGKRYHICIHADAITSTHEKWTEKLAEINECSDGVTVDLSAPSGGRVWVGNLRDIKYQSSSSDVTVYWDSFVDVEEERKAVHPSGIANYYLTIGSVKGGEDILAKTNVGLVNHKVLHGLSLQNGHTYHVSVQATDFVNRSKTVYSEGFIVDNTGPETTSKPLQFVSSYITSRHVLSVCWTGSFKDSESGISWYRWTIGSRPGYQDIVKFIQTSNNCGETIFDTGLQDGLTYYFTVEAMNGAGLTTSLTSRPVIVDSTPPVGGLVFDVVSTDTTTKDIDYIVDDAKLAVKWQGFHDPHSSIKYYKIKLGTCVDCDDVISQFEAGNSQYFAFHETNLIPGRRYITTVTGCNMADMCTSVSSDGIIFDKTPPVPGGVLDGTKDSDIDFQATRKYIGVKWYGFKDGETGIERYEWRVGTSKGSDDLFKAEDLPVVEITYRSNIPDNKLLPVGTKIYITIRAFNKAGLYSEATSNGFTIDTSLPAITRQPVLSSTYSSIKPSTIINRLSIKVEWKFTDGESDIERQYISIAPHVMGDFKSSAMKIPSILSEYTFPHLDLHDGSKYKIKVIACNLAGLCRLATTEDITVDSSPPTPGMFTINTDHAARLTNVGYEWIKWTSNSINMAWYGFADLHTGISQYIVSVGTKPFLTDLNKDGKEVVFDHVLVGDEGTPQKVTIDTKTLTIGNSVFIAVWAVNGVGLKSLPAHSEFVLNAGFLDLVRRCVPYNCNGHCVCAAQNEKCSIASNCNDISQGNANHLIQIYDVTDLTSSFDTQTSFTPASSFIAAGWTVTKQQGLPVIRYEVSAGQSDKSQPSGIYNTVTDRVWYDVGENMKAIIALPRGINIVEAIAYSVFVRVWYDKNQYAVFKSPGITQIKSPPTVSHIAGVAVKEVNSVTSDKDIDYQTSTNQIIVRWKDKFRGGIHGLGYYKIYISTHPQGHNIHQVSTNIAESTNIYTATGLSLEEDREYYSTVIAYNKAGLVNWTSSDGITIDNTPPTSGIIHDGNGIEDSDYQSSVIVLSASWYGFSDLDSGIVRYFWCASTVNDHTDCGVQPWKNVGLQTRYKMNLTTPLLQGTKIYNKVYVEDGSGLKSPVAVSNSITVDNTPPQQVDVEYLADNIIKNPSFEQGVTLTDNDCDDQIPTNWNSDSTSCVKAVQSHPTLPKAGGTYIKVRGQIRQTVTVQLNKIYQVTVHVGYPHDVVSQHHSVEGFVQLGMEINTFKLDPNLCQGLCDLTEQPLIMWYKFTYVFHPTMTSENIIIGTSKNNMILAIDDIQLYEMNYIDVGSDSNHLVHHAVFRPFWSSVHLSWHFKDDESPITEYKYALGTVKGGSQIREFTSVSSRQHVTISGLQLAHNTLLYLTVMGSNAAGLTSISLSDSIIVDMTSPVITHIYDGSGSDVKFQLTRLVSVNWIIEDKESGIEYCQWAIGSTTGSIDIKPFSLVPDGQMSASFLLDENIVGDSKKVYSTVRCYNGAELPTTGSTDGVLIVQKMADVISGLLSISPVSLSQYPVKDKCHPTDDSLRVRWNLVASGIDTRSIQVSLIGGGTSLDKEIPVTDINYNQAKLTRLKLQQYTNYTVGVSTINILGRQDNSLSTQTTSRGQPPIVKDVSHLRTANSVDGKTLEISWRELFESIWNDLYYEVSLGTLAGGADILQWQETKVPSLSVSLPDQNKISELFLTLTAVDPCGLFTHFNHTVIM